MVSGLEQPVLVLNRLWQPIHTCTARRAVKLLCQGQAKVVQTEGVEKFMTHDFASWLTYSLSSTTNTLIHSVSLALQAPQVIVLELYDRMPKREVKFCRTNVFLRDSYTCQYCKKSFREDQLNLDHVIPREKGGQTSWQNIVTSCISCNSKKANKLPHQAGMHPLKEPQAPKWKPLYTSRLRSSRLPSWNAFLTPPKEQFTLKTA